MRLMLPAAVISTLNILHKAGWEAYIVGGAVRDLLMEKTVEDWDFATNAHPEEIQKLFPGSFYDNLFGTVGIPMRKASTVAAATIGLTAEEGGEKVIKKDEYDVYEVTTFRTEQGYTDRRRPDSVEWGKTLEEDLSRRDFTVNAMAVKVNTEKLIGAYQDDQVEVEVEIIDPFKGRIDLSNKLIRAVGNSKERFAEDALRMMRAVRLGAQLGFAIEPATLAAIGKQNELIRHVSWERIRDEFLKILASQYPADGVLLLSGTGILEIIMPELAAGFNIPQGGHHIWDVFTHSVESLRHCPSSDVMVRLATLLHDVGKPPTFVIREGKPTFYGHEVVGARIVKTIADRLRLSVDQRNFLWKMVRWHMFTYDPIMTDAAIRRFMRRVGREDIPKMMELRVGDRKGGGSKETSWRLEELKHRIEGLMHDPLAVRDLHVDGRDVMAVLKIKPGPEVGEVLDALFEEVLEDPKKNEREYLLGRIKKVAGSLDREHTGTQKPR